MITIDQRMRELGGTFVSPESGNRGDPQVRASMTYIPQVSDEEAFVTRNDILHNRFVPIEDVPDYPRGGESEDNADLPSQEDQLSMIKELVALSPVHLLKLYEAAGKRGEFSVMNLLPRAIRELNGGCEISAEILAKTPSGRGHSCYKALCKHAASEKSVLGSEDGIACRILKALC